MMAKIQKKEKRNAAKKRFLMNWPKLRTNLGCKNVFSTFSRKNQVQHIQS